MQIVLFLPHYQLVYVNFDFSSFSLISYRAKGRLSHLKRASFTMRKGIFYRVKVHLLFSMYESLLQPFLYPFLFHNKQITLPLHYYNNTIKTTTSQFSCHSCHSSLHHNALITSRLHEMLKVTANEKQKYGIRVNIKTASWLDALEVLNSWIVG